MSWRAGLAVLALLATPAAAHEISQDWLVECDNTGQCTALSLAGDVVLRVTGTAQAPVVTMTMPAAMTAAMSERLRLEGLPAHTTPGRRMREDFVFRPTPDGLGQLTATDAAAFVQAAPAATSAVAGSRHVSLNGLGAALARMGREQPRDPPASPPPISGRAVTPGHLGTMRYHALVCGLGAARVGDAVSLYPLADGARIIGVDCGLDGPNAGSIWLVERVAGQPKPAAFPTPDRPDEPMLAGYLANSRFDPASGTLHALTLSRPQGDCGKALVWRWTAAGFVLVEAHRMPVCAGVVQALWPRTWLAP